MSGLEANEPLIDQAPTLIRGNDVFGLEARGFDHIPDAERNMTLGQIAPLWLGANMNMFTISVGCVSITLGLSLWQALAACVVGNLPYLYLGLASVGAVRAGLPITTLSRAAYGVRGNRLHAGLTWAASVCFEVFNGVFGVYAWLSLIGLMGLNKDAVAMKLGAVVIQLALGGGIAILGHATMIFLQKVFAVTLGVVFVTVLVVSTGQVHWASASVPRVPLATATMMAAFMAACGVIASQPVSYLYNGPDWVRYLPTHTSAGRIFSRVFWWTFAPSVVLTGMGALWASLGDMSDPVAGLRPLLPPWLYIVFVVTVIAGSIANNVPTFYSSGLSLQAMGLNLHRWAATCLDVAVSTAAVLYILFVQDLSTALNNFVALLVAWSGPYAGVWLCDGLLRHWRFDLAEIHPVAGAVRLRRSVWRSWLAFAAGASVAVLTMRSPIFIGPVTRLLGGMDLSWLLGLAVSAGAYALLVRGPAAARPRTEASC